MVGIFKKNSWVLIWRYNLQMSILAFLLRKHCIHDWLWFLLECFLPSFPPVRVFPDSCDSWPVALPLWTLSPWSHLSIPWCHLKLFTSSLINCLSFFYTFLSLSNDRDIMYLLKKPFLCMFFYCPEWFNIWSSLRASFIWALHRSTNHRLWPLRLLQYQGVGTFSLRAKTIPTLFGWILIWNLKGWVLK